MIAIGVLMSVVGALLAGLTIRTYAPFSGDPSRARVALFGSSVCILIAGLATAALGIAKWLWSVIP